MLGRGVSLRSSRCYYLLYLPPHLPRHHLKGWIYKNWLYTSSKSCFCFLDATQVFISSMSRSWKAGYFFFLLKWNYSYSKIKIACQTGPLHQALCLLPWRMSADSSIFSANQAAREARCEPACKKKLSKSSQIQLCLEWQVELTLWGQKGALRPEVDDQTNTVCMAQARPSMEQVQQPCMLNAKKKKNISSSLLACSFLPVPPHGQGPSCSPWSLLCGWTAPGWWCSTRSAGLVPYSWITKTQVCQ